MHIEFHLPFHMLEKMVKNLLKLISVSFTMNMWKLPVII